MNTRRPVPHLSLVTLLGAFVSGAAHADFMNLAVQVRTAGLGEPWSDSVNVSPDTDVDVRFVISFDRTAGWLAWAGCTISQLNVSGSAPSDRASDFSGLIQLTTQTFQLWGAGTTSGKIDRLDNPAASIQMAQRPPDQGALSDNPIVAFSFRYHVGADAIFRDTQLDAPSAFMTLSLVYISSGGLTGQIVAADRTIEGAVIHVTPTPVALAPFAGLALARRRR